MHNLTPGQTTEELNKRETVFELLEKTREFISLRSLCIMHFRLQRKESIDLDSISLNVRAEYQSRVVNKLREYRLSGIPFVVEGLDRDLYANTNAKGELSLKAKKVFPSGMPKYFAEFSSEQVDFLWKYTASFTLLLLDEIPKLYKSIHPENFARSTNAQFRAEEAMACIKEVALKGNWRVVIFISDDISDFATLCEREKIGYLGCEFTISKNSERNEFNVHKTDDKNRIPPIQKDEYLLDKLQEIGKDFLQTLETRKDNLNLSPEKLNWFLRFSSDLYFRFIDLGYMVIYTGFYLNVISADAVCNLLKSQTEPTSTKFENLVYTDEMLQEIVLHIFIDDTVKKYYVQSGIIKLEQLVDIAQKTPWVLNCLRCQNILQGIKKGIITIEQLCQLTPLQTQALTVLKCRRYITYSYSGKSLQEKVREFCEIGNLLKQGALVIATKNCNTLFAFNFLYGSLTSTLVKEFSLAKEVVKFGLHKVTHCPDHSHPEQGHLLITHGNS